MKVINLWAGPGAGKSTLAAGLFHKMKSAGETVELVTEYPKELVYEDNPLLANNLQILTEQDRRQRRLVGKVEYAITDNPLPVTTVYRRPPFDAKWFDDTAWNVFNTYDNINIHVRRVKPYYSYGRYQNEDEARALDDKVSKLLFSPRPLSFVRIDGNEWGPTHAYDYIKMLRAN